ncbi:MAG: CaiB/BaiF CoA transferase family protein [Dethiobacteria bacterium]|jgi:crotonobetainyl-CoA:carnitine CoA-transferase CaiB-like acyl-CoA transferase
MKQKRPLEGIKILDLTWVYAGPFGTLLLSDLGAEVTKVEGPPFGDWTRVLPPLKDGWSGYFYMLNRGKKSVALNLKSDQGREVFLKLIKEVDVIAENFTPGTMDKMGLGYEQLKEVNPRIIYASISGFGTYGPYAKKRSVDPVAQAMGGLMSLTGYPEMPPLKTGPAIADSLAGMNMALGILSALMYREKTGSGQRIDISMMDSVFAVLEESVIRTSMTGDPLPARGNTDPLGAPWDAFPTSDGKWVMVCAIGGDTFYKIYESIGRKDLAEEYKGDDEEAMERRSSQLIYLNKEFAKWTKSKTVEEITAFCDEMAVPCGEVKSVVELLSDPQLLARNMVVDIEHPKLGSVKTFNNPIKFSEIKAEVQPGENPLDPQIGEHSAAMLEKLGYTKEDIERLKKEKVIWM